MRLSERSIFIVKAGLFAAALLPLAYLVLGAFLYPHWLGPNPAEYITRSTGEWTLRMILLTLVVTPLRRMTGWPWLLRLRRMVGLFSFFYGVMHLTSYVSFDHVFDIGAILADIVKRPFITVGFTSLVLMLPLALTSTNSMVRRLGGRRWQNLHKLIYVIAPLGVLHFWWMVKRDLTEPVIYALILALLLGYRLRSHWRDRRASLEKAAKAAARA
jgi:methionine sulfoxide reductase heme-binding subunit